MKHIFYYIGYLSFPLAVVLAVACFFEAIIKAGFPTVFNVLFSIWVMVICCCSILLESNYVNGVRKFLGVK